jgi:glycosyltransferase involved in cell wall biosynthesis
MRIVLIGDGQSPHLLKWARALSALPSEVELWVVSSRGFDPGFGGLLPSGRRLALGHATRFEGGNFALLSKAPQLIRWLHKVQPDWLAPHYLSSHGTLAWLAVRFGGVRARIAGSAWGSDILVSPVHSKLMRFLTRRVLGACTLATSDSRHMTERMKELGAGEVMTFPFGLEVLPNFAAAIAHKDESLFFTNRALEPVYRPQQVLAQFAAIANEWPKAKLVVAHDGSLRPILVRRIAELGLQDRVQLVGRLDAEAQNFWYSRARWYLSLPQSDSVSVSVLEAMAHGCIPILSDLPANQELVTDGHHGLILAEGEVLRRERLAPLAARADVLAAELHRWVGVHALFPASVDAYVSRLRALSE